MKKALLLVLIMVVALLVSGISDSKISIADTSVPDNELTSNVTEADNLSDNATITITWTTARNDGA